MRISVNGISKNLEADNQEVKLTNALEYLGYKPNTVVVELNNLIINSTKWDYQTLKDGDKLEIVSIVGGG